MEQDTRQLRCCYLDKNSLFSDRLLQSSYALLTKIIIHSRTYMKFILLFFIS